MTLVFASNNEHKLHEIRKIAPNGYEICTLATIGCTIELAETGSTLEDNALQKAKYIFDNYGVSCFADDTGLEIESLNGEPGVYSARYAGENKNAEKNISKVLTKMDGVINRRARFRTVIAAFINQKEFLFEGIVNGKISVQKQGSNGFGYDPIFIPEGSNSSFAEMNLDEKNKLSHRAIAFEKFIAFLKTNPH